MSHKKFVLPQHGKARRQLEDGGDGLQMWRVAEKQLQATGRMQHVSRKT